MSECSSSISAVQNIKQEIQSELLILKKIKMQETEIDLKKRKNSLLKVFSKVNKKLKEQRL